MGVGAVAVAAVGCGRMAGVVCSSGWGWNSVWGWAGGRGWAGEEGWAGGAACTGAGRAVFSTAAAWRPAKGGLKIPPVGEAAVSPGRAATVAVGIVHTASPC